LDEKVWTDAGKFIDTNIVNTITIQLIL